MTHSRPNVAVNGQYALGEAAHLLGINRRTLYRWRKLGYISTKIHRYAGTPFIEGREILKLFDVFDWREKSALINAN